MQEHFCVSRFRQLLDCRPQRFACVADHYLPPEIQHSYVTDLTFANLQWHFASPLTHSLFVEMGRPYS
jgi:hypothetical protein